MNRIIFQVLLVVVSVGLFFTVADPTYRRDDPQNPGIKYLQNEIAKYDEALTRSQELIADKKRLTDKSNAIKPTDRANLERLLPDAIDNIRLLIDIDSIALRYGLVLKNVRFTESQRQGASDDSSSLSIGGNDTIGTVTFGFSVSTRYETFKAFLRNLEQSLRLIDITELSVSASETATSDVYDYNVTMKTYWLK